MSEVAVSYVSLLPSAKGFGRKLDSQIGGEVQSSGKRLGVGFGKMFAAGGALLAAAGEGVGRADRRSRKRDQSQDWHG